MGIPRSPEKALLFAGMLYSEETFAEKALSMLVSEFGPVTMESGVFRWDHTGYYSDELGGGIRRRFAVFDRAISPEDIAEIKLSTNRMEKELSRHGRRRVNIDPGYIALSKIVLATTKNYCHRIYLGRGIYAEVTLWFREGTFRPTPFTYPDYRQQEYIDFFNSAREMVKKLS